MAAKGTAARRYDQQFKATVLDALQQHLDGTESVNAAISATAAQFANHDGGGPSPSTVRNWGEAAGVVEARAKRAESAAEPKRKSRTAARANSADAAPDLRDAETTTTPSVAGDALTADPIDIDAVRAEATAPLAETLAKRDEEIAELRDLVSSSEIDLITRVKALELELSLLRPLVELYLHKQQSNS